MPARTLPPRRWFRFSLATFLFICLCIAGLLAGFQSGYRRGYDQGQIRLYNETQITESYSTTNIIWPDLPEAEKKSAFDSLKDLIQTTIATDIWNDGRGNDLRPDPFGYGNLIVTAPGETQKQIRHLLATLEKLSAQGGAQQLLPVLQSLASQGKTSGKPQDSLIPINSPKNSQIGAAWFEKYFQLTINGISEQWGLPRFRGKCTDAGFPAWSADQQIATWRHGGGLSYIALRTQPDGRLQFAAGWRNDS